MDYSAWFKQATGYTPRAWQLRLSSRDSCDNHVVRVPTGQGKTLGILAAWAWHRCKRNDASWPRRLVWCLPMRVLTEQTEAEATSFLKSAGLGDDVRVHTLMGGVVADEWHLHPEANAVLVGTQDMLLSRALNRGYGCGRARWPMDFGLVSHDSLWVFDEVQLMDVALATSAQLQSFRDDIIREGGTRNAAVSPARSWWMSATLQPEWLKSIDTKHHHARWVQQPTTVLPEERATGPCAVKKGLRTEAIAAKDDKAFAELVLNAHQQGSVTLVVCNTVDRACATFERLSKTQPNTALELVHSRFRPADREPWRERFLNRSACAPGTDRIIIATQVVEAGVDISAACLVTELAPWPSLVQRFGRCARYDGEGQVIVVDRGRDDKQALPYDATQLDAAHTVLTQLTDVGIASLESFEEGLDDEQRASLYPYVPEHLLRSQDLDELFDNTPDLTGADLDISRFIRTGDERDVQVFWIELAAGGEPEATDQPRREALCSVPFLRARNWLCGEESKTNRKPRLRGGMRAWVWDFVDNKWKDVERSALRPGRTVCVASACGGYDVRRGFDPQSRADVSPVASPDKISPHARALLASDLGHDDDTLSKAAWKTIAMHGGEVAALVAELAAQTGVPADLAVLLELAGRWHDLGKCHPAFQGTINGGDSRPDRVDLAKAPDNAWRRPYGVYPAGPGDLRRGFRHELASALALFALVERYRPEHPALVGGVSDALRALHSEPALSAETLSTETLPAPGPVEQAILALDAQSFDLVVYLVASHHGKVRLTLRPCPADQTYRGPRPERLPIRGVLDGDVLPAVRLHPDEPPLPELTLSLTPASLGCSPRFGASWRERTLGLQKRFGPALAWMEMMLRAADIRASRLTTCDPAVSIGGE